jgi:serine/threonine-protein kinase
MDELIAAYLRALEQGRAEEWLREEPHREQMLANFIANQAAVSQLFLVATTSPPALGPFGDYTLLAELGRGGMGIVYRARQHSLDRLVALKMLRDGDRADAADRERFSREAQVMARLNHPHLVPIHEVGECNGVPYFTMKLFQGGSLAKHGGRFRDDPAGAAALVAKIAEAVQHAHDHAVMHRDLKPANILLDEAGEPYVTDFGLAIRIDQDRHLTESGVTVGTACYMAPEQAAGRNRDLTMAVDVHGLGLILYELLTGASPFRGESTLDTLLLVQELEPPSPRMSNPRVDRDLSAVCLKCLEKDPRRRYRSAAELAADLGRWQKGKPVQARPVRWPERLWRWCRRHPDRVGLMAATLLLLVGAFALAVGVARARAARLEEETLTANVYAARGVASTILWQMDRLSQPVLETATGPNQLADLLECHAAAVKDQNTTVRDQVRLKMHEFICAVAERYHDPTQVLGQPGAEPPFQTWHLLDQTGILIADTSDRPHVVGTPSANRDYFQGAVARANGVGRASVHISRVYQSRTDTLHKFALSVAVRRRPGGPVLGVIAATLTTTATLGSLRLDDERRTAVLVSRRDFSLPGPVPEPTGDKEYIVLLHPAYTRGVPAVPMGGDRLRSLHQPHPGDEFQLPTAGAAFDRAVVTEAEYVDPVGYSDARFRGRWLAGFAPVGNTEFVVVVQQRYDETIGPELALAWNMTFWTGVGITLGILLVGVLSRWWFGK